LVNSDAYKQYVRIVYNGEEPGDTRVLINSAKNTTHESKLRSSFNGIILDLETLKYVCVPPMAIKSKVKEEVINNFNAGKYDIFEVYDGTNVNLYYYKNKLTISTANGIDMIDMKWLGSTYKEVLKDLFCKYEISVKRAFDKNFTYTFNIQHPMFHQTVKEPKITLISIVNNDLFNETFDDDLRKVLKESIFPKVPCSGLYNDITMDEIKVKNMSALSEYMEDSNKVHLGYLLRSKTYKSGDLNKVDDIFIPSTLSKYVITKFYDMQVSLELMENRKLYIIIQNYLNNEAKFSKVFSQYTEEIKQISECLENIYALLKKSSPLVKNIDTRINNVLMFRDKKSDLYSNQLRELFSSDSYYTRYIHQKIIEKMEADAKAKAEAESKAESKAEAK
jgi:hypothetical protein